ncbi:MAG: sugar phosphate isomerase/epimerase [Phycisphaeraceae bacterium]|nr:MAG: sugar phosphate isomerase/epimerase [Phycisphaeraceae bacterium]
MKLAFSTVACPDWTLERVASAAREGGYLGVELRTFGYGSTSSACDPALTSPAKVQGVLRGAGVELACVSSSCRFDAMVTPPVIGWVIGDPEASVREGREVVELAHGLRCGMVRVFGFEYPARERRARAIDRIAGRIWKVADIARARQVRLVVENGGSFTSAAGLLELLDAVDHPSVGAAYTFAAGALAGDTPYAAVNALGDRLMLAKLKDYRGGVPCALGDGENDAETAVRALASSGYTGWVSYEFDRAWVPGAGEHGAGDLGEVLARSAERVYGWSASSRGGAGLAWSA